MLLIGFYLPVAVVVACAAFLIGEWIRDPGAVAPDHPGLVGLAAGLLWPVLAVGIAQLTFVVAVQRAQLSE